MPTFPIRHVGPFQKPPKGERLRSAAAVVDVTRRTLTVLYRKVYKRDNYTCVACGRHVEPDAISAFNRAHPHHIVPRSLASKAIKNTKENVCTVCPTCHADIGDRKLFIAGNAEKTLKIRRAA